jgi:hypothetical protein
MLTLIETNPNMVPPGTYRGMFLHAEVEKGKDDEGNEFKDLVVSIELDVQDPDGKKFQMEKRYSLLPRARGLATFRKDYRDWSGKKLTDKELATFDEDRTTEWFEVTC